MDTPTSHSQDAPEPAAGSGATTDVVDEAFSRGMSTRARRVEAGVGNSSGRPGNGNGTNGTSSFFSCNAVSRD